MPGIYFWKMVDRCDKKRYNIKRNKATSQLRQSPKVVDYKRVTANFARVRRLLLFYIVVDLYCCYNKASDGYYDFYSFSNVTICNHIHPPPFIKGALKKFFAPSLMIGDCRNPQDDRLASNILHDSEHHVNEFWKAVDKLTKKHYNINRQGGQPTTAVPTEIIT